MSVRSFQDFVPELGERAFVDEQAAVIGRCRLGKDVSIWPMAVLRGDVNHIAIGARSNIQDGTVVHVTHDHPGEPGGHPVVVGEEVTVGHNVTLHGCRIGDRCLVGMSSTVLDGAELEAEVLLGAGSLVPPGKRLEGGHLWMGSPVRKVRALTEEEFQWLRYSAEHYVRLKDEYLQK